MKVACTGRVSDKLIQIMPILETDWMVKNIIYNNYAEKTIIPENPAGLRQEALEMRKNMPMFSVEKIMLMLMVEDLIGAGLRAQGREMTNFFMSWIAAESKIFDVKEFNKNPYIQNIDFTNHVNGDFELRYLNFAPFELNIYNVAKRMDEFCIDIPRIGCFTEKFKYPGIFQKSIESTWMSVSPNEVFTMEKPIRNAKGKVLTLGCGMGYFAYMASRKKEVESIVIVELEQTVIELFEEYILPQFENKEKISIVKADAVEYLQNIEDGVFDYCFADIWLGAGDIENYFTVKEQGRRFRKTKIDYWIEESFAMLLLDNVWMEIMEEWNRALGQEIPPLGDNFSELDKKRYRYIHRLLEDEEITKPEHIIYYMKPQTIISLINKTDLIF